VTNLVEIFLISSRFQNNHSLPSNNRVKEWVELFLHSTTCHHGMHRGNVVIGRFADKHKPKGKFDSSDMEREKNRCVLLLDDAIC